jgi:hypothetical protein
MIDKQSDFPLFYKETVQFEDLYTLNRRTTLLRELMKNAVIMKKIIKMLLYDKKN